MAFKLKDGIKIGTVDVLNNSGQLLAPTLLGTLNIAVNGDLTKDGIKLSPGSVGTGTYRVELLPATLSANRTITLPNNSGTMALTSDIGTGAFGVSIGTAGATGSTVTWGTASGFTANAASASTYDLKVGPALTSLATLMTGVTTGFIKKTAADTYTLDTNTYLTSYTETDTLQTVTARGATSNLATISLTGNTASSSTTSGTLVVTGGVGISGALNVGGAATIGGSLIVTGNLQVDGTVTTVNSTTITVDDKNIELGSIATPTDALADGGGITLRGTTDKTFNWINSTGYWTSSVGISAPTLISTVAVGTAPLTVTSTTLVSNLNADLLDGQHGSYYAAASSIGNGAFGVSIGAAGATGSTVTWGTASGFTANAASASTYDLKVGPALTSLATLMTGATTGIIKKTAADTYTLDTNTYLTSETDTLASVTARGNTTITDVKLYGSSLVLSTAAGVSKVLKTIVIPSNITVNTATAIDSWSSTTYRSAKYTIQVTQGTKYQISEYYVIHDGTAPYVTEFAVLENSSIPVTFSTAIATNTLTLSATITDAATTNASIIIERTLFVL